MSFKKYITLIRAGMIEALQFRLGTLVTILGNLIYLVIVYYLWKAIYASVNTPVVNGMTFQDTLIYLVLATALFYFMEDYLVWFIGRDIQTGKIVLNLIKPMKFRRFMFFLNFGGNIMSFFTTFLPTFVIVFLVVKGSMHLGINLLFFVIGVFWGLIINYYINFFVSTICLYTQSTWGINIMKEVIVTLLSGATIPLAFFPEALGKFVMLLPFQAIYNTPLRFLIDYNMPMSERLSMIAIQVFWVILMGVVSDLFWKKSLKIITVNGG